MRTVKELISKVKELRRDGYIVHTNYKIGGDKFGYEGIGNKTVVLIMRSKYYNKEYKKWYHYKDDKIKTIFNRVIKSAGVVTVTNPVVSELSYDDSLKWLFHHYKWGDSNNANVVLLNSGGRILAIQYNGVEKIDFLHTKGVYNVPDYIVLNNSKKLKGKYRALDYKDLEHNVLSILFNKNILCKAI